jgi:hypothetical protein
MHARTHPRTHAPDGAHSHTTPSYPRDTHAQTRARTPTHTYTPHTEKHNARTHVDASKTIDNLYSMKNIWIYIIYIDDSFFF